MTATKKCHDILSLFHRNDIVKSFIKPNYAFFFKEKTISILKGKYPIFKFVQISSILKGKQLNLICVHIFVLK